MVYNKKTHLRENIDAIYLALHLERDKKQATSDEKEVLSQYSGFGGIKAILTSTKLSSRSPSSILVLLFNRRASEWTASILSMIRPSD